MASEASPRASMTAYERFQNHKLQQPFEPLPMRECLTLIVMLKIRHFPGGGKCCLIAARLWRCTQNFCGARMMREFEMRGEFQRAKFVVTVMTYQRTRCPILNQV